MSVKFNMLLFLRDLVGCGVEEVLHENGLHLSASYSKYLGCLGFTLASLLSKLSRSGYQKIEYIDVSIAHERCTQQPWSSLATESEQT